MSAAGIVAGALFGFLLARVARSYFTDVTMPGLLPVVASALVLLTVALVAVRTLQRSRFGRNVVAVRDNPVQAAAMGISVTRTRRSSHLTAAAGETSAQSLSWSGGPANRIATSLIPNAAVSPSAG